jgi:hypothetical protein
MIALSILQPWAWLIVNGYKDIENRSWSTKRCGTVLIHAGKRWGAEQRDDLEYIRDDFPDIPLPAEFDLGGIVGAARIVDCVSESTSPWFNGPFGFVLDEQRRSPLFVPWRGQLGFFDIPASALDSMRDAA